MKRHPHTALEIVRLAYAADTRATTAVLLLACVNAFAVAATGLSVREVADATDPDGSGGLLPAAAVGALAYALIASVQRVQHNLQVDLTERVDLVLSERLHTLIARTPTLEHLERPDYLDRLSGIRSSTETLAGACWGAVGAASSLLSLGLSAWLLMDVHPALALLVLLSVPPLLFSRRATDLLGRARDLTIDAERREAHLHGLATGAAAAKELRISGGSAEISRRASAYWSEATSHLVRAQRQAAVWQAAGWTCFAAGYVAALALVADLVARGDGTAGDLLMVASISGYLRTQLSATVSGATQLAEGEHTMRQYRWLQSHTAEHRHTGTLEPPNRLNEGVTLRGLTFAYPGTATPVLRGVDLRLRAGTTVAVVGINGAGKTTLVKLLTGMYEPDEGEILVDGTPLRRLVLTSWRNRVSAAFQDFCKLQTTARHTVGVGDLPRAEDHDAVARAVAAADAQRVVDRLPQGLDSQLGIAFDGAELSHGQWQKLALGRALMRRPLLSVLDEPTAALDPQSEHDLFERFTRPNGSVLRAPGHITLLISHRFSTVRAADHIVVLDQGRVAEEGTHEQLMSLDGQYAELYRVQSRAYT
ncbi:ABC transporter ATP-binding protein [Streptomyces sp. CAU 1734]|uniref:ABC transporter ATP-binding protein n=1 Tax=Streptomyces sp. CAU 1734 TaxID=3140360 RepID=UPI00325FE812